MVTIGFADYMLQYRRKEKGCPPHGGKNMKFKEAIKIFNKAIINVVENSDSYKDPNREKEDKFWEDWLIYWYIMNDGK